MARKKIKSATDQRKFTIIYNDFLESDLLNHYEKLVFIALKKYADNDTMKAFPSLNTLHKVTGISMSQVRRSINHMKELGVISIEHRTDEGNGHQSNLYTLYDYAEIWNVGAGSSEKQTATIAEEITEKKLIAELRSKGYIITKEKELDSEPTKAHCQAPKIQANTIDSISKSDKSQDLERYTIDQIRQLFDYDIMLQNYPEQQSDIDTTMSILYNTMNTTKPTIRVAGQDKPSMVVISKFMKLDRESILYAIKKFSEQTDRIKNPIAYLTTILYTAKEQYYLDIKNQVNNDIAKTGSDQKNNNESYKDREKQSSFHNFTQRTYDYDALEKELLNQ